MILCTRDTQGHVFLHNMFVGVQTPQYIVRERPSYGLRETDGYSNATHISCKFIRRLSPHADAFGGQDARQRDGNERGRIVDLRQSHYMYPIYSNDELRTSQGTNTSTVHLYLSESSRFTYPTARYHYRQ